MSSLEKELYSREGSGEGLKRLGALGQIKRIQLPATKVTEEMGRPTKFRSLEAEREKKRRRIIRAALAAGLLLLLFGGAAAATWWYRARETVRNEQINLSVTAPEAFTAGDEITYTVNYSNDSFVDWQNVEVDFTPPATFAFVKSSVELAKGGQQYMFNAGTLKAKERGQFTVQGTLLGQRDAALVAKADMAITPVNFPSGRFARSALITTTITAVPMDIAVEATPEAVRGERTVVTIIITNTSSKDLNDSYLLLEAMPGLQLAPEDPEFTSGFSVTDRQWIIPALKPFEAAQRKAVVILDGQAGEKRMLNITGGVRRDGTAYVQRTVSAAIAIASSELSLEQQYNQSKSAMTADAGQLVRGAIKFTNTGTAGLKDVIIRAVFDGDGMDPKTLKLNAGAYDAAVQTITWTAATVPELKLLQPKQTGEISYEFIIRAADAFPASADAGKNKALVITASADSPDVLKTAQEKPRVVSDRFVISIRTNLTVQADAFYDDGRLGIKSDGPLPPQAGEQTTYTVRVRLGSTLNDAGDVRVAVVLPDGVKYTGQVLQTLGNVSFNERAGEVDWQIPLLSGLTGRTQPAAELDFQVAITPAESQRGEVIPLLNRLEASGTDEFTESGLLTKVDDMPTTESAAPGKGIVPR